MQPLDVGQDLPHETAGTDESRDPTVAHGLLGERHDPFGCSASRGFRFASPAHLGLELAIARRDLTCKARDLQMGLDAYEHFLEPERFRDVVHGPASESLQEEF